MNFFCLIWYYQYRILRILPSPLSKLLNPIYRLYCIFGGIDIPYQTQIGNGLKISHPNGIVINENSIIGDNVWIRCNTCIGNNLNNNKAPIIKNDVNIGANVVIIGSITIGEGAIIGAGSVITKDVPPHCVVVGNPARIIRHI